MLAVIRPSLLRGHRISGISCGYVIRRTSSSSSCHRHRRLLHNSCNKSIVHQPTVLANYQRHIRCRYTSFSNTCPDAADDTSDAHRQQQHQPITITFLTDVEGDGLYFDRFVYHSKVLGFKSRTPSFGRYEQNRNYGNNGTEKALLEWNLGEWDDEYFPYDKEVVFLDEELGTTMLVYGVRKLAFAIKHCPALVYIVL